MKQILHILCIGIRSHPDIFSVVLILFFYLFSILLVSPFFEIPVDDGFAFAWSVQHFFENGTILFSDWVASSFIFLYVWGILFCLPFGYSFSALTVSVLLLSCATAIVFYLGCRRVFQVPATASIIATLTLLLNPLFYELSNYYVTDVPYIGLLFTGIFLCWSSYSSHTKLRLFFGSMLIGFSFLTRQVGIFGLFAVLYIFLLRKERRISRYLLAFGMPCIMILLYFIWTIVLGHATFTQSHYVFGASFKQLLKVTFLTSTLPSRFFNMIMDLGLFLFPLVLPYLIQKNFWRQFLKKDFVLICIFWGLIIICGTINHVGYHHDLMPFMPNIFIKGWARIIWLRGLCTVIAIPATILVFTLLTSYCIEIFQNNSTSIMQKTFYLVAALHVGATLIYFWNFDTYLLPIIALLLFLMLDICSNNLQLHPNRYIAAIVFCLMMLWTPSMTAGNFKLIKTMWRSAEKLRSEGIPLTEIDGYFEWNHWYHYQDAVQCFKKKLAQGDTVTLSDMFNGYLPLYKVDHLPVSPRYQAEKEISYSVSWLPVKKHIYILKRVN